VRLTALFGGLFAAGAAVLFALLYWRLGAALEARDHAEVIRRAAVYATAYEFGGLHAVRGQLANDQDDPTVRSLFLRIVGRNGQTAFAKVPPAWLSEQAAAVFTPDNWGGW